MSARMAKLDRVLSLVHLLSDTTEGLTLDDMARELGVNRRTAERLRDLVSLHFDIEDHTEDRRKFYRIRSALARAYTRPTAAEIAALQTQVDAQRRAGTAQAALLESLLAKTKASFDAADKRRIEPDLEPLARFQTTLFQPGPRMPHKAETLAAVHEALMAGLCVEFDYWLEGAEAAKPRCVVPLGVVHGPTTYLIGQFPDRAFSPVPFRFDRMNAARPSTRLGMPPDDWDLQAWMDESVSIWREEQHDVVLRVLPDAVERARNWCFHPLQVLEEDGDCLTIRFRSGGLWQIADHVFTWRGDVVIEGPEELRDEYWGRIETMTGSDVDCE